MDLELIQDCDLELVFVKPWVFGEVKKVRIPKGIVTSTICTTKSDSNDIVITENDAAKQEKELKECSVPLIRMDSLQPNTDTKY